MSMHHAPQKANHQTTYIAIALILGVLSGELLNLNFSKESTTLLTFVEIFNVLTDIFLQNYRLFQLRDSRR